MHNNPVNGNTDTVQEHFAVPHKKTRSITSGLIKSISITLKN